MWEPSYSTAFSSLSLASWRQFHHVHLEFHPRLTIITGGNGSGKTAILRLLARHCDWWFEELAVPLLDEFLGISHFTVGPSRQTDLLSALLSNIRDSAQRDLLTKAFQSSPVTMIRHGARAEWQENVEDYTEVGLIRYDGIDHASRIRTNKLLSGPTYQPQIDPYVRVAGIFVPSHRTEFAYRAVESIPIQADSIDQSFVKFSDAVRRRAQFQSAGLEFPPSFFMKEALVTWAFLGYGNQVVPADQEKKAHFEAFQDVMRAVLPPSLQFERIEIRLPEVVLVTRTGDFMMDAVSGGIAAILELSWQIFVRDPTRSSSFVVIIDEVENHLHASMQRTLLPALIDAFPNVQFIVSTHSPLVVGSVRNSTVYALRYNEDSKVSSERLDLSERAGTATAILREVLGVPVSAPVWVEHALESIADKYQNSDLSDTTFNQIRADLKQEGLEEFAPMTIAEVVGRRA